MQKIKIIVADDHPVFRSGMVLTLKKLKFISKVAEASNGIEVLSLLKKGSFDLILMDINMKPMDGIETTQMIKSNFSQVKVIALTMRDDIRSVIEMFECGSSGYLLKSEEPEKIEFAIKQVVNGEKYISQSLQAPFLEYTVKQNSAQPNFKTSYHQKKLREIIYLISNEFTSAEIADIIALATRTVEVYRAEILSYTNSHNTVGIVKYAIANNIDQDPSLGLKFKAALKKKASEF